MLPGILEDDDVAAADFSLRQERHRLARSEDEFVDQQMVADSDCVLHRAGRHLHRLNDEGHAKHGHDHGHDGRFEVFPPDRFWWSLRLCFGGTGSFRGHCD